MSNITYTTALALKNAGMPQPEPKAGQFWYKTIFEGGTSQHIAICILLDFGGQIVMQAIAPRWDYPGNSGFDKGSVYAPDLDYIAAMLPDGYRLEMWDGRHSCKFDNGETQIWTQADSFVEAAVLLYLELNK